MQKYFWKKNDVTSFIFSSCRYVAIKHPFTSRFSVAFKKFNPVSSSSFKGSEKPIRNSRKATLSNLTAPVTKNNNQSLNTVDRKRVLVYALVVLILSTLVCFPMFFEYHVRREGGFKCLFLQNSNLFFSGMCLSYDKWDSNMRNLVKVSGANTALLL